VDRLCECRVRVDGRFDLVTGCLEIHGKRNFRD
jgi:hypothetical protein